MACVTGDETGIIKLWDLTRTSGAALRWSYGEPNRKQGIAALCWVNAETTQLLASRNDGSGVLVDFSTESVTHLKWKGRTAVGAGAMAVCRGRIVTVGRRSVGIDPLDGSTDGETTIATSEVEAAHVHRRLAQVVVGGASTPLTVYDVGCGTERDGPIFTSRLPVDRLLGIAPEPNVSAVCASGPFHYASVSTDHVVHFFDRRASMRPVQKFDTGGDVAHRPTALVCWNANKYIVGDASGETFLYDTRRGFALRAKYRGGAGSVRQIAKHPGGAPVLATAGLDRKARVFHAPTATLLGEIYATQQIAAVLLNATHPFCDGSVGERNPSRRSAPLGDDVWDAMEPAVDDMVEDDPHPPKRKRAE